MRVWLREFGVSFFPGAELFTEGGLEIWGGERMHCACGHRCHPYGSCWLSALLLSYTPSPLPVPKVFDLNLLPVLLLELHSSRLWSSY